LDWDNIPVPGAGILAVSQTADFPAGFHD